MSDKLTPELFREAIAARVRIVNTPEKASDKQLYGAACVLARIRLLQGQSVPAALANQDLAALSTNALVPDVKRESVLEYLLSA
jgi:hypothetical protein